jgi:DNA polymerase-3 subunit delta'
VPEFEPIPRFESILGQKKPISLLTTLLRKGIVPHALLFTGIDGIGKRTTALVFAMACNCLDPKPEQLFEGEEDSHAAQNRLARVHPCGRCKSCRKIISGNHPDIIIIEPAGSLIKIGQIRALIHTLALKPFEARRRVVIISDSQTMNPAASNALLKVLEEPPDQTILILTARQLFDLFSTIVSRCQHIRFSPISRKNIMSVLMEKEGVHPDDAAVIATLSNGSIADALDKASLKNRKHWIIHRNWLIDEINALTTRPIGLLLAFAAALSKNKDRVPDSLEMIKSYLRDLVICKHCPEKIINTDLTGKIQHTSPKLSTEALLSKISAIQSAQKQIQANANLRLTLEAMIMRLAAT